MKKAICTLFFCKLIVTSLTAQTTVPYTIPGDTLLTIGSYTSTNGTKGILFTGYRDIVPNYFGASIETTNSWECCGSYPSGGYAGVKHVGLNFNIHTPGDWSANAKTTAMSIDRVGNIGIGTTNISDKLVVSNGVGEIRFGGNNGKTISSFQSGTLSNLDIFANSAYFNSNMILGSKKILSLYNNAGNIQDYATMQIKNTENLALNINGKEAMSITNNGYIGIDNPSPNYKLEVNGDISVGSNKDQITGYGSRLYFNGINEVTDPVFVNRYNCDMNSSELRVNIGDDNGGEDKFVVGNIFWGDGQWHPFLSVANNGLVRIGSENSDGNLQVKGTITAKEVTVKDPVWADFVFDKNYKLRDLKEVDQYIQDNGHLPDIPSEAEVKEKGVNLVEVQAKLLQKLEEITLYAIEQNKKIEQQNTKMNRLEKRIKELEHRK